MNPIDIALRIATSAHAGQLDRDGYPVILHPLTVGLMGHTDEEKIAGFLHDVVEDTAYTFEDLLREGIPSGIVGALRLLSHKKGTDYYEYVQGIIDSGNPIALQVKYNDLQHNYARGKAYPDLQKKHGKALEMVKAAIEACSKVDLYYAPSDRNIEVGIFACGCFWGTQHQFQKQEGVLNTLAGYTGGQEAFPTYADVRDHKTHHVEAVIVEFDPLKVSYESLCKLFFEIHDPAQTDGVGPDLGPQYRSCIFYRNEAQRQTAERVMQILRDKGDEVNTLLLPEEPFYIGEEYHQRYYEKTGGEPYCHVRTKKF
ncbi:MAG: peptide-methionine (S)-S-oxide reductase MsrA [Bacteroidales bacterium]|nr:peptide-methionine (S)-S-oxide reductase MsrA [Bacteroidales bacterium]